MPFSHLKLSAPSSTTNLLPSTLASSRCGHVLDSFQVKPSTVQLNCDCRISLVKNLHMLRHVSLKGPPTCKGLKLSMEEASHVSECKEQGLSVSRSDVETEIEVRGDGLTTKRNVPWNKGKKHNVETRKWISFRTKEALKDPKVRMKMSERPRPPLSKRTRKKIGASQARLWDERLKWKRSREKFFAFWSDSIAKAAKRGGLGQDKLDWNSYEKLKREIVLEQLQLDADRAEAKLIKQLLAKERAEEKARVKAEKMEKLAQKRKDDAERAKLSGKSIRKLRSKEETEELAVARELKLKERLTKIHKKKSRGGHITVQNQKAWDSLDLESSEKKETEASFADQIQAIRSKRAERVSRNKTQMAPFYGPHRKLARAQLVEKEMKIS